MSSPELRLIVVRPHSQENVVPPETAEQLAPTAEQIRAEVRRVVRSVQFDASERNRRFLEYVVEEALAGRADRIKAYTIATVVFGRDATFDPQQDPVVRMEARRLRRSLERFYFTEGRGSSIRITMPKGGYVPEFCGEQDEPGPQGARIPAGSSHYATSVLVKRFTVEGDQSIFQNCEQGLSRQLMIGMSRYPHLCIFGSDQGLFTHRHGSPGPERIPDLVITGSKAVLNGKLLVKATLQEAKTGRILWGQNFDRDLHPKGILRVREEVANTIVRSLAEPHGVIFNYRSQADAQGDARPLNSAQGVILFHQYRRTFHQDLYRSAREVLERAVASEPECPETMACLSQLYTDGHRFCLAPQESHQKLRRQAIEFAYRAIDSAPDASCGYHALGLAYWFQQDVEASLEATQTALALNTNAVEILADLGVHWSLLARWERALPLLENASAMGPGYVSSQHVGISLYHFMCGRFEEALFAARAVHQPRMRCSHVLQAIALTRLGRRDEAADALRSYLGIDPHGGRPVLFELSGGNLDPGIAERIGEALDEAGLPTALRG